MMHQLQQIARIICKLLFSKGKSDHWCSDLLKASEEFLSSVTLKQDCIDEERLMRHLFTVGAVAQVCNRDHDHDTSEC